MSINLTLFGEMLTFLFFIGFTMRYVWPPLKNAMKEREDKIAKGLRHAEESELALELAERKAAELLEVTRGQAGVILEEANERARRIDEQAREEARATAERIKDNAMQDIDLAKIKMRESLRQEVATLAISD